MIYSRFHPYHHIVWTLTALNAERCIAQLPLPQHIVIVLIFLWRNFKTFFCSPTDFVQPCQRFAGDPQVQKILDRFLSPFKGGGVDLIKLNVLVILKKSFRLRLAALIQAAIHAAALNNVLEVEIGLPVADDVDFFAVQFSIILGAKIRN